MSGLIAHSRVGGGKPSGNSTRRFARSGAPVAILALSRYFELHRTFIVLLNARSGF